MRICNLCGDSDTTYTHNTNAKLSQLLVKTTNGTVTKYVYGRGLIGEETENVFKTYHFDYRGSTVALTDSNGNITDTFTYDTYGKLIEQTGTSEVIFGYNGRDGVITDKNGLIYMRARYYSPEPRRFINADVIAGQISNAITLNRYAYANGNPVSNIDPFGLYVASKSSMFSYTYAKDGGSGKIAVTSIGVTTNNSKRNISKRRGETTPYSNFAYTCFDDSSSSFIEISQNQNNAQDKRYVDAVDADGDGAYDFYVYEYVYTTGIINKKTNTGKVYIYTNANTDFFENSNNHPKEFNPETDLMIGDFTNSENPNMYAYQAHKLKSKYRKSVIAIMQQYDEDFNTAWDRTDESLMVEWNSHVLFSIDESAQNVDFDNNEESFDYFDFINKAFSRGYSKVKNAIDDFFEGIGNYFKFGFN